jgi:chemotaxis protein methyltransferase CheR
VRPVSPVEVTEQALTRLVALIREETGNVIPRARLGFLEEIAARRARARGFIRASEYAAALAAGVLEGEWEQLVPLVTVKESFFFRAPQQFGSIERHVLPRVLEARGRERTLRIWSAAAARGEEPATLAMILMEHEALSSWDWRIVATDLDAEALAAARRGLYGERAVAQVPGRLLERWFHRRGSLFELDAEIRGRIDYLPVNLARPPYRDLPARRFDLILLRNVLIYFRRPLQRRVISEVGEHLAPHGYVFLGASETLWQIHDRLEPVELDQCFGYRHPAAGSRPRAPAAPPARAAKPAGASAELEAEPVVADEVPPAPAPPPSAPAGGGSQDLLFEAARALAGNRLDEAAERVARAREADPSEPAVYALEGFLHDLASRAEEAAASYRAALYLAPGLYQVRVLLADCLRRLGHPERSEHEFRQVLATLDRGTARDLVLLEELPFPNRTRALRRCRQALGGR